MDSAMISPLLYDSRYSGGDGGSAGDREVSQGPNSKEESVDWARSHFRLSGAERGNQHSRTERCVPI